MTRILLVEDEPLITDMLTYSLQLEGFEVESVADGLLALDTIQEYNPDLVVLDLMLPGLSGLEICRRLRKTSNVPVIMLTARGEEIDRVLGLEIGADDYLPKPFSFRELLARIHAILRRVELDNQATALQSVMVGTIHLDQVAHRVQNNNKDLQLSVREFTLLAFMMRNAGRAITRDELLDQVWGENWTGDQRTLDVHIRWLRQKIEQDPASPRYIQTVRGFGYRFAGPEEIDP